MYPKTGGKFVTINRPDGRYQVAFKSVTGALVDHLAHLYDDQGEAEKCARRMNRTFTVIEVMNTMCELSGSTEEPTTIGLAVTKKGGK